MQDLSKYKTYEELLAFTESLLQTTVVLNMELTQTKEKLTHLEQVVKFSPSPIAVSSNEEELCRIEINRLYNKAKSMPLEFGETKAFEIYVKTLLAIQGKTPSEGVAGKKEKKLKPEQLLSLALQVADESEEQ